MLESSVGFCLMLYVWSLRGAGVAIWRSWLIVVCRLYGRLPGYCFSPMAKKLSMASCAGISLSLLMMCPNREIFIFFYVLADWFALAHLVEFPVGYFVLPLDA